MRLAAIVGCLGTELTKAEIELYQKMTPLGFILFKKNCINPAQVRALTSQIRELLADDKAPIMIDQEGGEVIRMGPPGWPDILAFSEFGELAEINYNLAVKLLKLSTQAVSEELKEVGINVIASPCLDLSYKFAHKVIGKRSFSANPDITSRLARQVVDIFLSNKITPIIKHIPGHGRALVDSHFALPEVKASLDQLEQTDFKPFLRLNRSPWAMTAHIKYKSLDAKRAVTLSKKALQFIRKYFDYQGILISDCISMKALGGNFSKIVPPAFAAGIDIVLCSQGSLADFAEVLKLSPVINKKLINRLNLFQSPYQTTASDGVKPDYWRAMEQVKKELKLAILKK
ncbi:MAG: glycoside hydrolase family 3 protein [SAR324 cluster bacterium]|nr:glycoside hydrolase family 3 protein [SAR324 cluster bacterium]